MEVKGAVKNNNSPLTRQQTRHFFYALSILKNKNSRKHYVFKAFQSLLSVILYSIQNIGETDRARIFVKLPYGFFVGKPEMNILNMHPVIPAIPTHNTTTISNAEQNQKQIYPLVSKK